MVGKWKLHPINVPTRKSKENPRGWAVYNYIMYVGYYGLDFHCFIFYYQL